MTERYSDCLQRQVLHLGFDTFGNHVQSKAAGNSENSLDEFRAPRFDLIQKLTVDLHIIEWKSADKIEVAMGSAEVIDRI